MKRLIVILFVFVCELSFAQAPSGCIIVFPYGTVQSYPDVYSNYLPGITVPLTQAADIQGRPVYDGQGSHSFVSYSCFINPSPSRRDCVVRAGFSPNYRWYGGVFAQNFYQCPIDGYTKFAIFSAAFVGFIFIKRRSSFHAEDDI